MNLLEQRTLGLDKTHGCRALCVVIGAKVDPGADRLDPGMMNVEAVSEMLKLCDAP